MAKLSNKDKLITSFMFVQSMKNFASKFDFMGREYNYPGISGLAKEMMQECETMQNKLK
jgi:hypothetical protein